MKRIFTFIIIVVISFIFFSCSYDKSTNPQVEDQIEIMPLKVGNSWTYNINQFNQNIIKKSVITEKITISYENENIEVYVLSWYTLVNDSLITDSVFYYYKNEDDGLYRYYSNKKELIAKYPIEPNESWTIPGETEELGNGVIIIITLPRSFECVSKNEEITTPIGTFECIKYVENSINLISPSYFYYCPGIGLVSFTSSITSKELIDYHLE